MIPYHWQGQIGERQETQILKFNSPPYTLSLQCPSNSKFSQLSYEPGCSRELWSRKCSTCSCTAAQLPLILCIAILGWWGVWGVGADVKFFLQKRILYSWTQNSPIQIRKISSNYLHLNQVNMWNVFEIWSNLCRKVAPRTNPEKQPKSEISLSQLLIIRDIQKLPLDYVFVDDKCDAIS